MLIQFLILVAINILISLPVFIAYSMINKIRNNNPFLKKLKIFITIVAIERVFYMLTQLIRAYYGYISNIEAITTFTRISTVVSDYIILPLSIIGVSILLYALASIKERRDIHD